MRRLRVDPRFGKKKATRRAWPSAERNAPALHAAGARELPGLEALPAEDRPPLRRPEGDGGFLAARGAVGRRLDPLARDGRAARGPRRALRFAGFAALWLVLEILVGEEKLLAGRPDELGTAVHAGEGLVLELHRSLPLTTNSRPVA